MAKHCKLGQEGKASVRANSYSAIKPALACKTGITKMDHHPLCALISSKRATPNNLNALAIASPSHTSAQCGATCCYAGSIRCTPCSSNLRCARLATVWVFGLTGCLRFLMKIHRRTSSSICRLRWISGRAAGRTRKFICHISACTEFKRKSTPGPSDSIRLLTKRQEPSKIATYLGIFAASFSDRVSQVSVAVRLDVGHDTRVAKDSIASSPDNCCQGLLSDLGSGQAKQLIHWHFPSSLKLRIRKPAIQRCCSLLLPADLI